MKRQEIAEVPALEWPEGLGFADVSWREMSHAQRAHALWIRDVYVGFIAQRSTTKTWHGSLVLPGISGACSGFDADDETHAKLELLDRAEKWFSHFSGLNLLGPRAAEMARVAVSAFSDEQTA